jgi:membrane protease YdiL (CAAX protease family)
MVTKITEERDPNQLLLFSLKHPILVMIILYFLSWVLKIIDSFIFRLDELLGEAILTKALGLLLVAVYVWACGRKLSDIGFHTRGLGTVLLITVVGFGVLYSLGYLTQLLILRLSGTDAGLLLSAVDPKTGLSGGLLFGGWLLAANLVNSAMEEGLFRGTMTRHFLIRFSGWGAILFQASLFALWHLSWPVRHLLDGTATLGEAGFEALTLLLGTFISGVVYGYFFLKTDNLWGSFLAHTINNGIFNVLFIRTSLGLQSGLDFIPFTLIFLIGHLVMIPIIGWTTTRLELPQAKPWGEFEELGTQAA